MEEKEGISPFTEGAYKVSITAESSHSHRDLSINESWAFVHHVSKLCRKIFFGLFNLIKNEALTDNYSQESEDDFGNIVNTLFKNFGLDDLNESRSLENSLNNHLSELQEYKFYLPSDLVEGVHQNALTPLKFDIGYEGDLELTIRCIKDVLKSLRDEKIGFWKTLIKEYGRDKEGYDLGFRTISLRQEKDLDRASKITPEDLMNVFKETDNNKRREKDGKPSGRERPKNNFE